MRRLRKCGGVKGAGEGCGGGQRAGCVLRRNVDVDVVYVPRHCACARVHLPVPALHHTPAVCGVPQQRRLADADLVVRSMAMNDQQTDATHLALLAAAFTAAGARDMAGAYRKRLHALAPPQQQQQGDKVAGRSSGPSVMKPSSIMWSEDDSVGDLVAAVSQAQVPCCGVLGLLSCVGATAAMRVCVCVVVRGAWCVLVSKRQALHGAGYFPVSPSPPPTHTSTHAAHPVDVPCLPRTLLPRAFVDLPIIPTCARARSLTPALLCVRAQTKASASTVINKGVAKTVTLALLNVRPPQCAKAVEFWERLVMFRVYPDTGTCIRLLLVTLLCSVCAVLLACAPKLLSRVPVCGRGN